MNISRLSVVRTHITVIHNDDDAPLARLQSWLEEGEGFTCRVIDAQREPIPSTAGAGLIVLGGEADAYADDAYPWLPATRDLLADSVQRGVPTLGICLGAQLLAVAMGGRVSVGDPKGMEVGAITVRFEDTAASDPVLGSVAREGEVPMPSWHADCVASLPERATALAYSDTYLQAFRVGSALGLQFHPEATPQSVSAWAEKAESRDSGKILRELRSADDQICNAGRAISRGFAAQVRAGYENSVE